MTVKELIRQLQSCRNQDSDVVLVMCAYEYVTEGAEIYFRNFVIVDKPTEKIVDIQFDE